MKLAARSHLTWLLALLLAMGGCYKDSNYSPSAPQTAGALTLATVDGSRSIVADGLSRVTLVAAIDPGADSDKRTVTFTTTSGSFVGAAGGGTTIDVNAGSDGRALAILQSSQKVETAVVSAVVKGAASVAAQIQIQFTAPDPNDVLRFVTAPGAAPADGATVTLFTVAVSPAMSTGTVTFSSSAGTFPSTPVPIGIDHTATAGLTSPKTIGAATVTATLNAPGGGTGFSRQTSIRFDPALPNVITVQVDNLQVLPGGKVRVTAHFTRSIGQVSANTVATFSARDANGNSVGGFENVTVIQPGTSATDSTATADYLPGPSAAPGPVTITAGTDPASVTGSTNITIVKPGS
ncbi:MAG: hypothetical protein ACJ76N_23180 [Thermoanaerobaculia bacterium]